MTTHANILLWKEHLPCRVRFTNKPQHHGAPGPHEHTGILFDVSVKTVKGKSTFEFYIVYNDPLNISKNGEIRIIEDVQQRPLKVFTGFQFTMTCYYNWDVNGNLAHTTRYLRDFRSQCTELETAPNQWMSIRNILRTPDPDVPLNASLLPRRNVDLLATTNTFNPAMCITRPHLYGRGGDGGGSGGMKIRTQIRTQTRTQTRTPKATPFKNTQKKRRRNPKNQSKYVNEDSENEKFENQEESEDDEIDDGSKSDEHKSDHKSGHKRSKRSKRSKDNKSDKMMPQQLSHAPYSLAPFTSLPVIIPTTFGPTTPVSPPIQTSAQGSRFKIDLSSFDLFPGVEPFSVTGSPTESPTESPTGSPTESPTSLTDLQNLPCLELPIELSVSEDRSMLEMPVDTPLLEMPLNIDYAELPLEFSALEGNDERFGKVFDCSNDFGVFC